jgi:hypothetical protein
MSVESEVVAHVEKMFSKKPPQLRLTAAVCINVMSKKYAAQFAGRVADWQALAPAVTAAIARLEKAAAPKPAAPKAKAKAISSDDDSDDDSDYESGDDDDSDDSDASDGSDDDDDDDDDDDSDDDDSDDSDDGTEASSAAPKAKKARTESVAASKQSKKSKKSEKKASKKGAASRVGDAEFATDKYALEMAKFVNKLKLAPRRPEDGESMAAYRDAYLVPLFAAAKLDPRALSKDAANRYKMRQEVALLEEEVDMSLTRESRAGRASFGVVTPAEAAQAKAANNAMFSVDLFDDED